MQILKNALIRIKEHHVNEYAIQCAYYVILSFIPFLILLFSLIQFTTIGKEAVFFLTRDIFPGNIGDFMEGIVKEASFKSIGTLSISIVFLLWSSGRGFFALCKGFNYIYETREEYNYWYIRLKSVICIILFIVILVVALLLITFGRSIADFLQNKYAYLSTTLSIVFKLRLLWQIIALFIVFLLMYKFVPNHKVKFRNQIPGAIFSAVGWCIVSWIFAGYLDVFKNFSVIYGSLTSIMLLMIWVYWCMYILLLGGEINSYKSNMIKKSL